MVMLKDSIWRRICDNIKDALCDECIEKRLKRPITKEDFKPSSIKGYDIILCNKYWLINKKSHS
jgi:hypothetical protein